MYIVAKHKPHAIPTVLCGAGCGNVEPIPVTSAYRVRIPEGQGLAPYDPRPKTPTGGRFGLPSHKMRRFVRTSVEWACVSCSLKHPVVATPTTEWFAQRCKKR